MVRGIELFDLFSWNSSQHLHPIRYAKTLGLGAADLQLLSCPSACQGYAGQILQMCQSAHNIAKTLRAHGTPHMQKLEFSRCHLAFVSGRDAIDAKFQHRFKALQRNILQHVAHIRRHPQYAGRLRVTGP